MLKKRIRLMVAALTLVLIIAVSPVVSFAVETNTPQATMTNKTLYQGQEFEVTLTLENVPELKSFSFNGISFNNKALELVSGQWLRDDATFIEWNADLSIGSLIYSENTDLNGDVFKFTFRVKDSAKYGDYTIDCDIYAKAMVDNVETTQNIKMVSSEIKVIKLILGDLNEDLKVNSKDVVHFVYNELYPDEYPLNQSADFDHDSEVDRDDIVYLLGHTLFPTEYPLTEEPIGGGSDGDWGDSNIGIGGGSDGDDSRFGEWVPFQC